MMPHGPIAPRWPAQAQRARKSYSTGQVDRSWEDVMQIGVVFPQTEIGADVGGVRAYAQAAEGLGYEHLLAADHVVGADPAGHPDWSGAYTHQSMIHEPFALFAFIAGVAPRLGLAPSVIILPQRQTALVAKQAAELDVLTNGTFRLGVGIGWNPIEFDGLGMSFRDRA